MIQEISLLFLFLETDAGENRKEGDAPETSQAYERIDDSAPGGTWAFKDPRDHIELKKAPRAPIQSPNDH